MSNDYAKLSCGCKGARVCAVCESSERAQSLERKNERIPLESCKNFIFCPLSTCPATCHEIPAQFFYESSELFNIQSNIHSNAVDVENSPRLELLVYLENFLDEKEECELVEKIDSQPWLLSQSGRRKQDYGPKVNFKQHKLKTESYVGMPRYSQFLLSRMQRNKNLGDYVPFELCNLEYCAERGSAIDFHIDDIWIWGERLISLNLLASSIMTLVNEESRQVLHIPMARRSLLCISGNLRYHWKHGIFRAHIEGRRIALTMREPDEKFKSGELYEKYGKELIQKASNYIEI